METLFFIVWFSFRRTQYKYNEIVLHSVQDHQNAHPTVHRKIIGRMFYIKSAFRIIYLFSKWNRDWCSRTGSLKETKMWIPLYRNLVAYWTYVYLLDVWLLITYVCYATGYEFDLLFYRVQSTFDPFWDDKIGTKLAEN